MFIPDYIDCDSPYDYFESWDGISAYDDYYYDDNDYMITIHRVTMLDVLLFPELTDCLEFHLWRDNDGNRESDWIDRPSGAILEFWGI